MTCQQGQVRRRRIGPCFDLSMPLTTAVFHSISELDPVAWDTLTGRQPFWSPRWLAYCERVLGDERPFYILVSGPDGPVAAAVFWLRRTSDLADLPDWAARPAAALLRIRPLLLCEIPVAGKPGLLLPDDPQLRAEARAAVLAAAREIARREKVSFTVFGYLNETEAAPAGWPRAFQQIHLNPDTALDVSRFDTYETYLASLGKKRRKNLRRAEDALQSAGVEIVRKTHLDPDLAAELAGRVAARHGGRTVPELRALVEHVEMVDSCWLVALRGGTVAGFDLLVGDRGTWRVRLTGSDYSVDQLYFALSAADIRFAITVGANRLLAGSHLYVVKKRIGYTVQQDGFVQAAGTGMLSGLALRMLRRM